MYKRQGDYEAFVKIIKEVLPGGLKRENVQTLVSKLVRFKQRTSLVAASDTSLKYLESKNLAGPNVNYNRNNPVHLYKGVEEIRDLLRRSLPVSGVVVPDEEGDPSILLLYKVHSKKRIRDMSQQNIGEQALNACLLYTSDAADE